MRVVGLALPIVIVVGVAITSCSSTSGPAKPAASASRSASDAAAGSPTASAVKPSPAATVPAGYTRVGGAAQGISVAAPSAWVAFNPTKQTIDSIASKIGLKGTSSAALVQDMESMQKLHGIVVLDVKSGVDSAQHFARNLNAYCFASGVTDVGAAGAQFIGEAAVAEFEKAGASHVTQKDLQIGGIPGVETSYQLSSSEGTIYGSQLEVLPKPNQGCSVTLTVGEGESAGNVLSVAAATAEFP